MCTASNIIAAKTEFLRFLRAKFTMIHNSNFFFRDLHYGVLAWCGSNGSKISYPQAEQVALATATELENLGIFKRVDHQSWIVNYPEFTLPRVEKKAS